MVVSSDLLKILRETRQNVKQNLDSTQASLARSVSSREAAVEAVRAYRADEDRLQALLVELDALINAP